MTPKMLLTVEPDSLEPGVPDRPWPMRPGSLCALKRLSERGILPVAGSRKPASQIADLLDQEQIFLAEPGEAVLKEGPGENLPEPEQVRVMAGPGDTLVLKGGSDRPEHTFTGWDELADHLLAGHRTASHSRTTGETDISVTVNLDGTGTSDITTGLPFYDHMLDQIARHGYMDIHLTCRGDLEIDEHHTIEDTAIALGEAIGMALGDKRGIGRYGFVVAMDETRSLVAIDLSGRPWCVFEGEFHREKVGDFPTEMTSHFFHSLAMALRATLHVSVKGENDHHQVEACFKGLARCLRQAVDRNEHYRDILPTSKGLL